MKKISANYEKLHSWEDYSAQLEVEYIQSIDEGKSVKQYKPIFDAVSALPPNEYRAELAEVIFEMVMDADAEDGYEYNEPSDLEGIKALRIGYDFNPQISLDKEQLRGKIYGAWMGRICGCLLGKTVEGIHTDELQKVLKASGNYPMHRYILSTDIDDEITKDFRFSFRGRCFSDTIECAPADDDTNYTVMAAMLVEKYGIDFTPYDVAKMWVDNQPKDAYCTAERVAFRNFVAGLCPPDTAIYKNPYREWIGAQIRGDYFGYINPGNPELAAEMAWRDASISHIKNGIYGEMFVSAMLACGAVCDDIKTVITSGLAQIPKSSRLFEGIMQVLKWYDGGVSGEECFARIHERFDERNAHDWCHTISNAMIVAASLLYGGGDFSRSICMAVQAGFDTDCNGATVGSIIGIMYGHGAIGEEWTAPVGDTLETNIFNVGKVKIQDMAELTLSHI